VSAVFPFANLTDALRAKWEGRHAGNIVLHPAG
jgi:hypothetical protein